MRSIFSYLTVIFSVLLFACGGSGEQQANQETVSADTIAQMASMSLEEAWATDTVMIAPESVIYDESNDAIYVANIGAVNAEGSDGDGFIAKMSSEGEITELKWVTGLNDPKGMGIHDGMLYVADIREVKVINLETGEIAETHPVEGAQFLNDITVDGNGAVYMTDSGTDKIHMLADGQVSTWMSDSTLQRPNGLYAEDDQILLASANGGFFAPISKEGKEIGEHWLENIPSADGIIKTSDGNYIVSTWQGEVHYVDAENNETQKLLDTKADKINSADIGYIPDQDMVLVPTFFDNRVVAYKINKGDS
ncbi:NHL repeat-containing protein [Catalinimonas niigatensis]|uniref:gluconolaconase n=1 Tax=Catalinimonas niigatensis TaxID=1397264 RepID=UPI002666B846|nr:gluconolaconase [Catalinimonas niigatensis]WPP48572.1 gluconolaconase [Catalinimonas niigatensis]